MNDFEKSVRSFLKNSLNINPKEHFAIAVEASLNEHGESIWKCSRKMVSCLSFLRYTKNKTANCELPDEIYASLKHANSFILLTPKPIERTRLLETCQNGVRFLAIENATKGLIERTFRTNYTRISNLSRKMAEIFSIGKVLTITCPSGTEATVRISRAESIAETGIVQKAGEFSFLPAGVACLHLKKGLDGRVALNRIAGQKKRLSEPVFLNITQGQITQIKGQIEAEELRKRLRKFGKDGRTIKKMGVGTNSNISPGYTAQEDERLFGSVNVSLGEDNVTQVQGKVNRAIKGIILKPTLEIDGRRIVENGKFCFPGF